MFPTLVTQLRLLAVARWTAFPIAAVATVIALVYPIPGELLVLAFDVVFAGCFVPLALGLYWKRATAEAAVYALVLPSILRVVLEVEVTRIPPEWSGIQTLVPPIVSLVLMVGLSLRKRV
jgi:Na+/proline symporter